MDKKHYDHLFAEGIKEKLEEILEDDIYHAYGVAIAKKRAVFNKDILDDAAKIHRALPDYRSYRKPSIDW